MFDTDNEVYQIKNSVAVLVLRIVERGEDLKVRPSHYLVVANGRLVRDSLRGRENTNTKIFKRLTRGWGHHITVKGLLGALFDLVKTNKIYIPLAHAVEDAAYDPVNGVYKY